MVSSHLKHGSRNKWRKLPACDDTIYRKLFNLADDIGEQRDLAATHPDKLAELKKLYEAWSAAVDADCRRLGIEPKMNDLSLRPAVKKTPKTKIQPSPEKDS